MIVRGSLVLAEWLRLPFRFIALFFWDRLFYSQGCSRHRFLPLIPSMKSNSLVDASVDNHYLKPSKNAKMKKAPTIVDALK